MRLSKFRTVHALLLALSVSTLLILRQYTYYLVNDFQYDFSWFVISSRILINYLIWGFSYQFLLRIAHNLVAHKTTFTTISRHIGISLLLSAGHRLLSVRLYDLAYFFYDGFMKEWTTPGNLVALMAGWFSSFLEYWLIMSLLMAISYYSRYLNQQKELNEAKLSALQNQLQPHFLFNTLNSISALIDIDGRKAQKMLSQLGLLLREILEKDQKQMISFQHELNYIKAYLEIEHIRFQDRLKLEFDVEEKVLEAPVPPLLLQPLVENAIKHGISKNADGGTIKVEANQVNENLEIKISNDCPVSDFRGQNGFGIGTKNVANRLQELYGEQQEFRTKKSSGSFVSEIKIPMNL